MSSVEMKERENFISRGGKGVWPGVADYVMLVAWRDFSDLDFCWSEKARLELLQR